MACFLCYIFWIALILISIKLYIKLTTGWCTSNTCMVDKTAIITGANTGIGYETAVDFAKRGARVILACRDPTRGKTAEKKNIEETGNPKVLYKQLDLSSLDSVRKFAEEINKTEKRLDILVNNAGAGGYGPMKSEDGLLMLMQINYFGHFLLTNLLLDLLKKSTPSRIVNVSALGAGWVRNFDVENLNKYPEEGFDKDLLVYARSKLCNILFTIEMAKRLQNTGVTTYSLHPGVVLTEIFRVFSPSVKFLIERTITWFFKNAIEGAQTTIYCSVEKGIEQYNGEHFEDCHYVQRYKTAQDPDLPGQLWKISEKCVGLK